MRFEDLRLVEPLLRAVRAEGYQKPTRIQSEAIPHVLDGRDVIGCAQTGTGKTAAFALPILQRLAAPGPHGAAPRHRIRALVLCPTRELAQQIHDCFKVYGRHTGVRQTAIFGGVGQGPQARALREGVDVLVATPGRLLDLMGQGLVVLSGIEVLVLDEADRMLDMGFLPDLKRIMGKLPRQRQTLLFSATMPTPIRELADAILHQPLMVQAARVSSAAPTVEHQVHFVAPPDKPALLTRLLKQTPLTRALVFTRTKRGADKLTRHLVQAGVRAAAMHGNKSQGARTRALAEFRSARAPVLVATDIAARGLDVDDISHVFNYDLTPDAETYVHRVGRTGRAGASGAAVSFCTEAERADLRAIERLLQMRLQGTSHPASAAPPAARAPRPAPRNGDHVRPQPAAPARAASPGPVPRRSQFRKPARRSRW